MEIKINSKIINTISDIEKYIDECKPVPFTNGKKIQVECEVMENYLRELNKNVPEEVARYQKVISNQEAILNGAREKAQNLINQAVAQTDAMVSENEVMKRAYDQADEIVRLAQDQAQGIVDTAASEANGLREAATQYMEDVMVYIENVLAASTKAAQDQYTGLINTLTTYTDKIKEDHKQLHADGDEQPADKPETEENQEANN